MVNQDVLGCITGDTLITIRNHWMVLIQQRQFAAQILMGNVLRLRQMTGSILFSYSSINDLISFPIIQFFFKSAGVISFRPLFSALFRIIPV